MQKQQEQCQIFAVLIFTFIFLLAAVSTTEAGKKEKIEKKVKKSDCGEWQWSVCVPTSGDCGLGTREGTRSGIDCKQTMKTQRCKIPCNWKKQFGEQHLPEFQSTAWKDRKAGREEERRRLREKERRREMQESRETGRQEDKKTGREKERKREREEYRKTGREKERKREKQEDRQTSKQEKQARKKSQQERNQQPSENKRKTENQKERRKGSQKEISSRQIAECKYQFQAWGECDLNTALKTRTGNLKRALHNADCQKTVTISKPCGKLMKPKPQEPKKKKKEGKKQEKPLE